MSPKRTKKIVSKQNINKTLVSTKTRPKLKQTAKVQTQKNREPPKLRKEKTKLEVYLPRLRNKAFPHHFNVSVVQLKFFDEQIFTSENQSIYNEFSKCSNHREHRTKFINKLASTVIGSQVVIKRYNEELKSFEGVSDKELVKYLKA